MKETHFIFLLNYKLEPQFYFCHSWTRHNDTVLMAMLTKKLNG